MGKPCPVPVIESKNRLLNMEPGDTLEVMVDNTTAVENLKKMAEQMKVPHSWEEVEPGVFQVLMIKSEPDLEVKNATVQEASPNMEGMNTVVVIGSEFMGKGSDDLGRILMKGFLYAVTELENLPKTVVLYNSGARLSSHDSESLEDLANLEGRGVEILTCGTCIDFFGLDKNPPVGRVTNMYEIVEIMNKADHQIQP